MALCMASKYPWGGVPRCTLPEDHAGDEHVAEGLVDYRTGKAPVIAAWPVATASATEVGDSAPRIKWKRTRPGHYIGAIDRRVRYAMAKVDGRWIVSTQPRGVVVGSAARTDEAKSVAEKHVSESKSELS